MKMNFETIYSIISKDKEIIRFTNLLFDAYMKVIADVLRTDNRKLTYQCLQTLIVSHKTLCESYTYISYIESMNTTNINYLKILNRYTNTKQETENIYHDLEKKLAKSLCNSDRSKNKVVFNTYKQILIYQKVIQSYYKEIASNNDLIDNLIYL